jgi:hypothetical protein
MQRGNPVLDMQLSQCHLFHAKTRRREGLRMLSLMRMKKTTVPFTDKDIVTHPLCLKSGHMLHIYLISYNAIAF